MRRVFLALMCFLSACDSGDALVYSEGGKWVKPNFEIHADLSFSCVHERVPELPADADRVFRYARWLQKNNQLKRDPTVNVQVERLYRIATENGHYKANVNLQNGAMRGHFKLSGREHLRLSEQLINENIATGYYFVAIFLKQGSAGLRADKEMSLRYYRKAADAGNAHAQAYVADKLAPIDSAPDIAEQMRRCAAGQGEKGAAVKLAVHLKSKKRYREALEMLQVGAAAGGSTAAGRLEEAFSAPAPDNDMYYLAQLEDRERARRY